MTASPDAVPVVRMVLGGIAARIGFSLEELEDLSLAVEELFAAAVRAGSIRTGVTDGQAGRHEHGRARRGARPESEAL